MTTEYKWFSMRIPARLLARIKRTAKAERRAASNWASGVLERAVEETERKGAAR